MYQIYFILERHTCFGRSFRPSSGVQELLMMDGKTVRNMQSVISK